MENKEWKMKNAIQLLSLFNSFTLSLHAERDRTSGNVAHERCRNAECSWQRCRFVSYISFSPYLCTRNQKNSHSKANNKQNK